MEPRLCKASIRKSRSSSPSSLIHETLIQGDGTSTCIRWPSLVQYGHRLITIRSMTRSFIPSLPLDPSPSVIVARVARTWATVSLSPILVTPITPHDRRYYYRDHRCGSSLSSSLSTRCHPRYRPSPPIFNRVQRGTVTVICRYSAPYDRPFSNRFRTRDI